GGPIDRVLRLSMIMRGDQQSSFPEEQAVFLAHRVLSRTLATRSQGHILFHDETSKERLPLFFQQIVGNSLKVLPSRTFWNETGFVPQVFCRFDVILDDEGAITQL